MSLTSNIPSDKRRPGTFVTFDDTSGARGLIPITRATALVGMKTSAGTLAVHTPLQVFNEAEASAAGGVGSELHLMAVKAFEAMRKLGTSVQLWLCAVAAPSSAAATRTFTFSGTATASGDVKLKVAGRLISVPVTSGQSNTTVAAAADAAIATLEPVLPVTAGVSSGVVTTTHRSHGVNGNDVDAEVVSTVAGITVVAADAVAGTGVASLVSALDALGSRDYLTIAVANHLAQDVTDILSHMDSMWAAGKKRWRHAFMGETGTLSTATTLASAANRKELIIGSYEGSPSLPSEIAAELAVLAISKERPSYNYDGTELTLYPPADATVYLDSEVETAILGGVTPLTTTDTGAAKLERLVTTKATLSSAAFEPLRDYANSATTAYVARQVDAKATRAMRGKNADERLMNSVRDLAYATLKDIEALGDIHHVDDHKDEILVGAHPSIPTRILLEVPVSPTPNAHQMDTTVRMFVEGA